MLAPDLIGFGQSDKPKREAVHQLGWHRDVLLEWLERLQPGPLVLVHSAGAAELASLLRDATPARFPLTLLAPDAGEPVDDAWRAPFPDRGYEAALRALGPIPQRASGPDAAAGRPVGTRRNGILRPVKRNTSTSIRPPAPFATRPHSGAA